MGEKPRVFISYRWEDGLERAEKLADSLTSAGFDTWLDRRNRTEGQWFGFEIEREIANRTCVVACLTHSSAAGERTWFRHELLYAKHIALKPVIPIAFPGGDTPIEIGYLTPIQFKSTGEEDLYAACLEHLFREIEKAAFRRGIPSPPDDPFTPYLRKVYEIVTGQLEVIVHQLMDLEAGDAPEEVSMHDLATTMEDYFACDRLDSSEWEQSEPRVYSNILDAVKYYNGRLLLLGDPGTGKSVTLLKLARDMTLERLEDPSLPLPIWSPLVFWRPDYDPEGDKETLPSPGLVEWLSRTIKGMHSELACMMKAGKVFLLLDGLDELGEERKVTRSNRNTYVRLRFATAANVHMLYPHGGSQMAKLAGSETYDPRRLFRECLFREIPVSAQVIVSCRVKDYHDLGELFELPGAVRLRELTKKQIRLYLKEAGAGNLWSLLESQADLLRVIANPLLLKLFTDAYGKSEHRFVETERLNPAEVRDTIFDQYIKRRYGREEQKSRRLHQSLPFSLNRVETVLQKLAADDLARYKPSGGVKWQELDDLMGLEEDWQDFVELTTRMHVLLPVDERLTEYRFMHLLLRDFLAFSGAKRAIVGGHDITRMTAIHVLGLLSWSDPRAFDELGKSLYTLKDDEYANNRKQIVYEMGQLGPLKARDIFLNGLRTPHSVRHKGPMAFKSRPNETTVVALRVALTDQDKDIQFAAAIGLARCGVRIAVPLLCEIAATRLPDAIGGAIDDSWRELIRKWGERLGEFNRVTHDVAKEAAAYLIDVLNSQLGPERIPVAVLLAVLRRPEGIDALLEDLDASESKDRAYAASALAAIFRYRSWRMYLDVPQQRSEVINKLIQFLKGQDSRVRLSATIALRSFGGRRVHDALIDLLKDPDARVREAVVEALGDFEDEGLVDSFLPLLKDENSGVRFTVALRLGHLGDPRAVDALILAMKDTTAHVRRAAVLSLGLIKDSQSLGPLIDAVTDGSDFLERYKYEICSTLDKFGDSAVDALVAGMAPASTAQRLQIVRVLGKLKNNRAADALINCVDDPQEEIALAALHEILDTGVQADGRVERRLEELRSSASIQIRLKALRGLAKLKSLRGELDPGLVEDMLLLHQDPEMDRLSDAHGKRLGLSHALEIMIDGVVPPKDGLACFARTLRFLITIRDCERALARLTRAIDRTPNPPWYFYSWRAEIASDLIGQTDSSVLKDCEKAIRLRPDIGHLYCLQGRVQHRLGRFRAALKDLREANRLEEGCSAITAHWIGWTLYEMKEYRHALKSFSKAVGLRKDTNADDHSGRGWAFYQLGRYRAAFRDFTVAKDVFGRRDLFLLAGEYSRALAEADKIIEQSPNDANSYQDRGLIYLKMNRSEEAFLDFTRAAELDPDNSLNYGWHALCRAQSGDWDLALTDLERERVLCNDDSKATTYNTFWHGVIREKQGLTLEAVSFYRRALDDAHLLEDHFDSVSATALITLMCESDAPRSHYEAALKEKPLRHQHYSPLLHIHILIHLFPERSHIRETWDWYQEKLGPVPVLPEDPKAACHDEATTGA